VFAVSVSEILRDLGYVGLGAMMVAENLFPPIPSEAILPLAGYLVGQGELSFALVMVVATLGSVIGAIVLYELARHGGRPFVLRFGEKAKVDEERLARAEQWFAKRGPVVVLGARCVPGARSLVSVPAGLLKMPRIQYVLLTTIGTVIWNGVLVGLGYLLGHEWETVSSVVGAASKPLLVATVVVAAALMVRAEWRSRRRPAEQT
jgi:membrane protein DedA with SNARE-associated domain